MKRLKASQLRLETLEQREVPSASAFLSGGNLTIFTDNSANVLSVTQTANPSPQLKVENNGKSVGVFTVPGNLSINTGNGHDNIIVQLTANLGFAGNVNISTGNGDDTVDVGGLIKSNLTINTGLGNNTVTSTTIDLTVVGTYFLNDGLGTNTFDLNSRNYTIGAAMNLRGVSSMAMGSANTLKVGGSATVTGPSLPAVAMSVTMNGLAVNVGGGLQFFGNNANDVVSITSQLSVDGPFGAQMNNGDNTLVLTPALGGNGIGGNFTYTGGAGVDVLVLGSESIVYGRTTVNLGHGINTFVDTSTSRYSGELFISGGDGTNTVVVTGKLGGNFVNTLGNGDGNTTVFTGSLAGYFRYRLGNGSMGVLTLAPTAASLVYIDAIFGSGDSTFNLGPTVTLSGIVRGTGGMYTFNQGTAVLGPTFRFINYP